MLFGEIVEPSTRALCEDDSEYVENYECDLKWDGDLPKTINHLYIGETSRITTLLRKCVIGSTEQCADLTPANVRVHALHGDNYVVVCNETDVISGLITEKLGQWIKLAKNVCILTSGLITLQQNLTENSPCVLRALYYKTTGACAKLEVPNMITGLSASVFSYCVHNNHPCTLYVGFFDEVALDSLNTNALLRLFEKDLGLKLIQKYQFESVNQFNNLYI